MSRRISTAVMCASVGGLLLAMLTGGPSAPVSAGGATFTVNSNLDAPDSNPGDGSCDQGLFLCTLRAAIMEANALPGHDTINLSNATYTLTLAGASEDAGATGDLDITDDVTIEGLGSGSTIIDGGAIEHVFHVDPLNAGITAQISGVTVRNGNTTISGGGISVSGNGTLTMSNSTLTGNTSTTSHGGALQNQGTATLTNVTISDNTATSGFGGGIDNRGVATLTNVTISGNTAGGGGGGIHNFGGTLTLENSVVGPGNSANGGLGGGGGGIENNGGAVLVVNSTVAGNTSANNGGGIANNAGTLTVMGTAVKDNTATGGGGGVKNEGTAELINATVTGNSAPSGGGLDNRNSMTVTNVTVTDNSASSGGGIWAFDATVVNTIFANNNAGADCFITVALTSSHSLDSDGSCGLAGVGDLPNTDPLLGPLGNYGGATDVFPLRSHSPAIDAGDGASCPSTDQRGSVRPQDGDDDTLFACDMGAFELQPVCAADGTVSSPPGVPIPDNDPGGVSSTVGWPGLGEIADLNLCVAIPHTWVGDLIVTLTHVDTGTSVTVIDRPGKTNGGVGCSGDDVFVLLDDEAGPPVENECAAFPAISGNFAPNNPLAVFDGEEIDGDWRLTVSDNELDDTGFLDRWDLLPQLTVVTPVPTQTPIATGTPSPTATAAPSATATPTASPTATPPAGEIVIWGDDNCSGEADPVDSLLTLRYDAGLSANTGDCPELGSSVGVSVASTLLWGDIDCSGAINPIDALKVLRFDAGLSVSQNEGCPVLGASVILAVT
jgi:CSLREA domain-containing protein